MTDNSPEYFEKVAERVRSESDLTPANHDAWIALRLRAAAALAREIAELRNGIVSNGCEIAIDTEGHSWIRNVRAETAESATRALQAEVDRLNRDAVMFHDVMECLRAMSLEHGLCEPPERNACTHCMGRRKLDGIVTKYRGRRIVLSAGTEPQDGTKP